MKLVLLLLAAPVWAQQGKPPQAQRKVDQKKVDAAIAKGVAYLKTQLPKLPQHNGCTTEELVLWTFVHANVPKDNPDFVKLFKGMMERPLVATYSVSLQALILEELDRVAYQRRLAQCAKFLADTQCVNGQWTYGGPMDNADPVPTARPPVTTPRSERPVATRSKGVVDFDAPPDPRSKPKVVTYLSVKKTLESFPSGDNSNTQYAALGIRACHEAGIIFPREVLERARKWWLDSQHSGGKGGGVATGTGAESRGWSYHQEAGEHAYGSMTAGAVGSLCIYDAILGIKSKDDKAIQSGLAWLAKNFSVTENVANGPQHHHYYLYALERAGILAETEFFGTHEWYPEGAQELLKTQRPDGSWGGSWNDVTDTCFAILFLRRATRRLTDVASVDRFHAPKKE